MAIKTAKTLWLKEEAKSWFQKRNNVMIYVKILHSELASKLHPLEFGQLDDQVRTKVSEHIYKKYIKQKKKLGKLLNTKSNQNPINNFTPVTTFKNRTINLTEVSFDNQEMQLLDKGLQYAPRLNFKNKKEVLIVDSEIALKNQQNGLSKQKIKEVIRTTPETGPTEISRTIKSLKTKIKNNNLILTKADKGGSTIILKKQDYINKVADFIEKERIQREKSDPTNKYQEEVKELIQNNKALFSAADKYRLTDMNPRAPVLYGLLKIHKDTAPIRPVVSYIGCPSYKLSKHLNTILKSELKLSHKYTIKNSMELTKKLNNFKMEKGFKLASLDISNMFGNIPTPECINIISDLLEKKNANPVLRTEITNTLRTVLKQNYFIFNNKIYRATAGLAMGSPLSPLLADIYMNNLEESILSSNRARQHIKFWYRYVDDIIICFDGTDRQLNNFLEYINKLNSKINFTLEKEHNGEINFLDLKISNLGSKLEYDIHRKPTFSDVTIPSDSLHPTNHKMAAYQSMVHRALSTPLSTENFQKEINTIKTIAINNGFDTTMVDRILEKQQRKISLNAVYQADTLKPTNFKLLTYYGRTSDIIKNELKKLGINVAFKAPIKLGDIIINNKQKRDKLNQSGIYKLRCKDCSGVYIGQSGRSFKIRKGEHWRYWRNKTGESAFASHLIQEGHIPDQEMEILHVAQKGQKLNLWEAIEIYKHKTGSSTLLNDQTDFYSTFFDVI